MTEALLTDCMDYMKSLPDNAFDLAVVDPPYGGVGRGGYMGNSETGVAKVKQYHLSLWKQKAPDREYFEELKRVSRNQIVSGVKFADCEIAYTSFDEGSRIFRFRWNGFLQGDMKNKEKRIHPTQKPVAMYAWIYSRFTHPGDRILDTHLGSGSSRIAAYRAGLDFVGCEIDETYYTDQENRFAEFLQQEEHNP